MSSPITDKLAVDGGPPVIQRELNRYKGASIIGEDEKQAVLAVLESRSLFRYYGPNLLSKVAEFEKEFAHFVGARHAAAATNGTAALRLGLAALGVGPGDEVIVPAVTFIASVGAVVAQRARPVFAEVDATMQLDPADLRRTLSSRTKAIMPVHLGGVAVDMDPVLDFAKEHGLAVRINIVAFAPRLPLPRLMATLPALSLISVGKPQSAKFHTTEQRKNP